MRILLITQGLSPLVNSLFESHHTLVGVAEDGPRVPLSRKQRVINKMLHFSLYLINKKFENLSYYCKRNNIPYFYIENNQEKEFENWVIDKNPDLIVIYSMSHLL